MDNTRIREIERVIDDYHKSHKAFTGTKEQMTYDLLTAYGVRSLVVIAITSGSADIMTTSCPSDIMGGQPNILWR